MLLQWLNCAWNRLNWVFEILDWFISGFEFHYNKQLNNNPAKTLAHQDRM
jgi:hypothetical protein